MLLLVIEVVSTAPEHRLGPWPLPRVPVGGYGKQSSGGCSSPGRQDQYTPVLGVTGSLRYACTVIAGSLFGGVGGAELGLHWANVRCAWSVEVDPWRRRVLKSWFPQTRVYSDVNFVDVRYDLAQVDIIVGGFPCQDVSNMGNKEGLTGARSGLWFQFFDIVRVLRPRYVVVENVSGLRRRGMGRVIGSLASIGYVGEWDSLPAGVLNAPHERDRTFIVAHRPVNPYTPARDVAAIQAQRDMADAVALAHATNYADRHLPDAPWRAHLGRGPGFVSNTDALRTLFQNPGVIFDVNALAAYRELCADQWRCEPGVGRVVDGIPARLDRAAIAVADNGDNGRRLEALGDAVVPQVVAFIALRLHAHRTWLGL
jgi:C-5 cytosine-specific DNA methylase